MCMLLFGLSLFSDKVKIFIKIYPFFIEIKENIYILLKHILICAKMTRQKVIATAKKELIYMNDKIQNPFIKYIGMQTNAEIMEKAADEFKNTYYVKTSAEFYEKYETNASDLYENDEFNKAINKCMEFEKLTFETIRDAQKMISYKAHKEALQDIKISKWISNEWDKDFFKPYKSITSDVINNFYHEHENYISENKSKRCENNPFEQLKCIIEILYRIMKKAAKIIAQHDLDILFREYPY